MPHHVVVVGGGITGIAAAHGLLEEQRKGRRRRIMIENSSSSSSSSRANGNGASSKDSNNNELEEGSSWRITVLEARPAASAAGHARHELVATDLNAQTIVPGAVGGNLAQRGTLATLARDLLGAKFGGGVVSDSGSGALPGGGRDFAAVPPYFRVSLWHCLGFAPGNTWENRVLFARFAWRFLRTSLASGPREAAARDAVNIRLARASRDMVMADEQRNMLPSLATGVLQLKRSLGDARAEVDRVRAMGEEAVLLGGLHLPAGGDRDRVVQEEPRLAKFPVFAGTAADSGGYDDDDDDGGGKRTPFFEMFAVLRGGDLSSQCSGFVDNLAAQCVARGVQIRRGNAGRVVSLSKSGTAVSSSDAGEGQTRGRPRYVVETADGDKLEADAVVLSAGIATPKIANHLGIAGKCPTFPMRGFSLTATVDSEAGSNVLPLRHAFSVDKLYVSSPSPGAARVAGFGEFVGYPETAQHAGSAAPAVLAQYGRMLFPEASDAIKPDLALACYRPLSPDDTPIVGETRSAPGLFFHTGHGSLGWTMAMGTAACLGQAVADHFEERENRVESFVLPSGESIPRAALSPDRF